MEASTVINIVSIFFSPIMARYGFSFHSPSPKKNKNDACFSKVPKGPTPDHSSQNNAVPLGRWCNFCGFHVHPNDDWNVQHEHHHDRKEVWKAFTKKKDDVSAKKKKDGDDVQTKDLTSWIQLYHSKPSSFLDLPAWMAQVMEHLNIIHDDDNNHNNKEDGGVSVDRSPTKRSILTGGNYSMENID